MAPFALYIALGTYKTHGRMMIALSLSGMIQLLLIFNGITRNALEKVAAVVVLGILMMNASNMNRIYYYTYLVYQQDRTMACQIIQDLKRAGCDYQNKAVVFIGKGTQEDIGIETSCTLGASFFEWDGGNIRRMIDVIKLEGCVLHMPRRSRSGGAGTVGADAGMAAGRQHCGDGYLHCHLPVGAGRKVVSDQPGRNAGKVGGGKYFWIPLKYSSNLSINNT